MIIKQNNKTISNRINKKAIIIKILILLILLTLLTTICIILIYKYKHNNNNKSISISTIKTESNIKTKETKEIKEINKTIINQPDNTETSPLLHNIQSSDTKEQDNNKVNQDEKIHIHNQYIHNQYIKEISDKNINHIKSPLRSVYYRLLLMTDRYY